MDSGICLQVTVTCPSFPVQASTFHLMRRKWHPSSKVQVYHAVLNTFKKINITTLRIFTAILQTKFPKHEIHHNNHLKIKLRGLQNAASVVQSWALFNLKRFSLHYLTECHQYYDELKILICTEERDCQRTEVAYVREVWSSELVFNARAPLWDCPCSQ